MGGYWLGDVGIRWSVGDVDHAEEDGDVGAGGEFDADAVLVCGVVVVLSEALADFAGGDADDGVGVGIVARDASEDLHADGAFLDLVGVAGEGLFDDEAEESGVTFALEKKRVSQESVEVGENGVFVGLGLRDPGFSDSSGSTRWEVVRFVTRF